MPVCEDVRVSLSAVLDGERPPMDGAAVASHLEGCAACRRFADGLPALTRRTRLTDPGTVPDLRAEILAALAREPVTQRVAPSRARSRDRSPQRRQWRAVVALAGIAQLVVAVPTLVGAGEVGHLAHDLAAFESALAVVFLLAAWQPARAGALALVATTFAGVGVLAAVGAVLDGGPVVGEVAHLVPVVGAAVLWSVGASGPPVAGYPRRPTAVGPG